MIVLPSRTTVSRAGVAATQRFVWRPGQRCVLTWLRSVSKSPRRPSTATILSPGRSLPVAGALRATCSTVPVGWYVPWITKIPHSSTKATSRLITGPAPMTTRRFHTGWRK